MKRIVILFSLLVVMTTVALLFAGCAATVRVAPPAARVEVYGEPPFAGAVWVGGYWAHRGGEYAWVPGRWERPPRPHARWVPGHWEERRGGWVWQKGHWEYR